MEPSQNFFLQAGEVETGIYDAIKKALRERGYRGEVLTACDAAPEVDRTRECVTVAVGDVAPEGDQYASADVTVYIQTSTGTDPRRQRIRELRDLVRSVTAPRRSLQGEEIAPVASPDGFAVDGVSDFTRGGIELVGDWFVCGDRGTWHLSMYITNNNK